MPTLVGYDHRQDCRRDQNAGYDKQQWCTTTGWLIVGRGRNRHPVCTLLFPSAP